MIYASTNCLKNPRDVIRVLKEYEKAGIQNVELGSVHKPFNTNELKQFDFNFIIHGYFPPPKKSLIFNLASQNKIIRKSSIKLAKNAISLCCDIDSPLYTFHAGFTVDPKKLGSRFLRQNIVNKEKSIETFVESVNDVIDYARKYGIKIAMETKCVEEYNLTDFLIKTTTDLSLLSISGYNALSFLIPIIKNTKVLGMVNKECVVSAGHLINNIYLKNLNNKFLFPLDSEHYSLFDFFNKNTVNLNNIKNIFLTATGGPFLNKKHESLKNATFQRASQHPNGKWVIRIALIQQLL